jgi:putative membrane protein
MHASVERHCLCRRWSIRFRRNAGTNLTPCNFYTAGTCSRFGRGLKVALLQGASLSPQCCLSDRNDDLAGILQADARIEPGFSIMRTEKIVMPIRRMSRTFCALAAWVAVMPRAWAHADDVDRIAGRVSWNADPWIVASIAVASFLYLLGIRRLWNNAGHGVGVPVWRAACFGTGMATLAAALLSPVDTLSAELFSMHMVQHELLMLVAAPLLVSGRPLAVFVWAFRGDGRRRVGRVAKWRAVRSTWHLLTIPFVAWLLHAVVLWGWHAPGLFQAGLASDVMHAVQHFSFLASALLFWSALIGPNWRLGSGAAVIYLLTTLIHTGMLGALLTFSNRVWYPAYAQTTAAWGMTALEDQQLGGLIMWIPAGLILLIAGLLIAANAIMPSWRDEQPAEHPAAEETADAGR